MTARFTDLTTEEECLTSRLINDNRCKGLLRSHSTAEQTGTALWKTSFIHFYYFGGIYNGNLEVKETLFQKLLIKETSVCVVGKVVIIGPGIGRLGCTM